MPGFRGHTPSEVHGFNALEKAFAEYRPSNNGSLRRKRSIEAKRQSVPTTFVNLPSSDEEESVADSISSAGNEPNTRRAQTPPEPLSHGLRHPKRRLVTPPHLTRENTGLPPTPPTMANSDDNNEPRPEQSLGNNVQFADAVRDALHKRQSGKSTPAAQLPTPDPSPPGTSEDLTGPTPHLLHPASAHHLRQYPSSRAESFHTARENPSRSQHHLPHTPSPEPLPFTQCIAPISFTRPINRTPSPAPTPDPASRPAWQTVPPYLYATPSYARRIKRPVSPYQASPLPEEELDLERHISYISNEEEAELDALVATSWLDHGVSTVEQERLSEEDVLDHGMSIEEQTSIEDVNNLVYKQIQEQNVKRHSLIGDASPIAAKPVRKHQLKRTARHESLRNVSGGSERSWRGSEDVTWPQPLRLRKAVQPVYGLADGKGVEVRTPPRAQQPVRSLDESPEVESSPRLQRVLPRLREPESPMSRMTRAALTGEGEKGIEVKRSHTLRHASKTQRLENGTSSRRTSAESGDAAGIGSVEAASPNLRHSSAQVTHRNIKNRETYQAHSSPVLSTRKLRHFSREAQLDHSATIRNTSPHVPSYLALDLHPGMEQERSIRHFPKDTKLENNTHVRRTSADLHSNWTPASPRKNSLDVRLLHPITTPMSTSQLSDQTAVEVCEAKGVELYPHTNHSLLVVQQGARPQQLPFQSPADNYLGLTNHHLGIGMPLFSANVQEPSPSTPRMANPTFHIDSPLTNPRAAPVPPAVQVIPPTPCSELDRQLSDESLESPQTRSYSPPRRSRSLLQRARRFSESFIEQPLFGRAASLRSNRPARTVPVEERPQTLSPFWQPRRFWAGYDSDDDEEYVDDYEDLDAEPRSARLPAGGDTSSIESQRRRKGLLPRSMSVRMPGFTGKGGFLVGNSLGLDRHGTNNRRHVVKKRSSAGGLHTGSKASAYVSQGSSLRKRTSEEMLKQMVDGKGIFTLPFSGGRRVQYVGVARLRERMGQSKMEREERKREKLRQVLREGIV
ncbi:hypothetical protein LTR97_012400 [Elasticomyces elasticus]|uniref:Uncharacterized protein n=1 Tax=Elasticomyces elasticus TaxID=574655 RepID=A0AAN7VYJ6_9PEZI|nr:hypothetical protein LTR97_012400 [Elasticomyces elasticus]